MIEHVIEECQCEGKRCTKCEEIRCIGLFSKDKRVKSGLKPYCQICNRRECEIWRQTHIAHRREYRERNKEQIRKRGLDHYYTHREKYQAYRQNHAEQYKEYKRKWEQNNRQRYYEQVKEHKNAQRRKRYLKDPSKAIERSRVWKQSHPEYNREYAQRNPEIIRVKTANRRARKKKAQGKYTAVEWEALKVQYAYTCLRCGKREPEIKLTPDHVIPLTKDGANSIENIQPLCLPCNTWKRTKIIDYRRSSDAGTI